MPPHPHPPYTHLTHLPFPRPRLPHPHPHHHHHHRPALQPAHAQKRNATFIPRPKRPYTFTQLVTLSDGSTAVQRTTSPVAVYRSEKDTRNTPLWNPSSARLANAEDDEAGTLRAFRRRFGRGWDAETARPDPGEGTDGGGGADVGATVVDGVWVRAEMAAEETAGGEEGGEALPGRKMEGDEIKSDSSWSQQSEDNLIDLIGSFGQESGRGGKDAPAKGKVVRDKGKGK